MDELIQNPRLRPVEAFPMEDGGQRLLVIHDPSGFAAAPVTVSPAAMYILFLMDGTRGVEQIQAEFLQQFGQPVPREQLEELIARLDAAHYLQSRAFEAHFQAQVDEYRCGTVRRCRDLAAYGIDADGPVAEQQAQLMTALRQVLVRCEAGVVGTPGRRLVGLIAPHLDYGRGAPCYADAYGMLAIAQPVRRAVILGTNHYGRGGSVVATTKDFETPLGITRSDRAFLEALQARCGADLCEHEFDHVREHSIELQALLLQHILGADRFEVVAALCPDPCGPTGTAPRDGRGVDLRVFAEALGDLIRSDDIPTLIVAGADLSHVGRRFGDECELGPAFLARVERMDREALAAVIAGREAEFVQRLTARGNATRVCSAGCIYALRTALNGARGELLRYHQAVDAPSGTGVTSCAAAFWEE